jgi:hypothetical protein
LGGDGGLQGGQERRLLLPALDGGGLILEPLCFGGVESGAFGIPGGFLDKPPPENYFHFFTV